MSSSFYFHTFELFEFPVFILELYLMQVIQIIYLRFIYLLSPLLSRLKHTHLLLISWKYNMYFTRSFYLFKNKFLMK